jgi:hypothetical protein
MQGASLAAELEQLKLEEQEDLEPIGELAVALLLQAYAAAGWSPVVVARPFAGGMIAVAGADPDKAPVGVMVSLEKNGYELRAIAETTIDALRELAPQVERIEGRKLS